MLFASLPATLMATAKICLGNQEPSAEFPQA